MNARLIGSVVVVAGIAGMAMGDIVFQDDFESGLGQWTGKNGGSHHGVLVIDPHDQGNTVLSFNGLAAGGDIFSDTALTLDPDVTYRMSFDYLGMIREGARIGDTGGYVGFSVGTPSRHSWQWATGTVSGASDVLVDDGQWHSYAFEFTSADIGIGDSIRLMVEDFSGSGGYSGDAYFDNFSVGPATVPTPGTAAVLGVMGLITAKRRRV